MSNALSNWKISENYKKSNLTWKDSGELCRLWMHLCGKVLMTLDNDLCNDPMICCIILILL